MARPSKRFALFLCLLVLHQDFIQARSSYNGHVVMSARMMHGDDDDVREFSNVIRDVEARHNITLRSDIGRPLERGKRFFGLFIFIVSLVVTVVATVVETVYDIAGCCGLGFSYLCDFETNFNRRRDACRKKSEQVDERLQKAIAKKDELEALGTLIQNMWTAIRKLSDLRDEVIATSNPHMRNILLVKEREVTVRLNRKIIKLYFMCHVLLSNLKEEISKLQGQNDQNALDASFTKIGEGQLALSLSTSWASVAVEGGVGIAAKAYKSFKVNKAYKAMKSTQMEKLLKASPQAKKLLGFTDDGAKAFLKSTAVAKHAGKLKTVFKGLKIFKAAGAVLSVLSIAFDLFNIINTFVKCAGKRDKAQESCGKLQQAEREVRATETSVETYENKIKTTLEAEVAKYVKDENMLNALDAIKQTIEGNPPPNNGQSPRDWAPNCIRVIPENIALFKTTSDWKVVKTKMEYLLEQCLKKQMFAFECLISRNKMNNEIQKGCQNGDDTFQALYQKALAKEGPTINKCKVNNEPYTTEQMYKQELINRGQVDNLNFFTDNCKMNNKVIQESVCNGGDVSSHGITPDQKKKIKDELNCSEPAIPSFDAGAICSYKRAKLAPQMIKSTFYKDNDVITLAAIEQQQCPE